MAGTRSSACQRRPVVAESVRETMIAPQVVEAGDSGAVVGEATSVATGPFATGERLAI